MTTVIAGTNRPNSRTRLLADHFATILEGQGEAVRLLDLADVPLSLYAEDMYDAATLPAELAAVQNSYFLEAHRFAIFVPEYNGSYPGVLKLLLDGLSVRHTREMFGGKYAVLFGVASGRAGNLRGMDHLAAAVAHLGGFVLPSMLPISGVDGLLSGGRLTDAKTHDLLVSHAADLLATPRRSD